MKTPIEQLIDALEKQIIYSAQGKGDTIRTGDYRIGLRKAIDIAFGFIEIEKTFIEQHFVETINEVTHQHNISIQNKQLSCNTCVFNTHSWSEDYPCATCCNFDKHKAD